MAGRYDRAVTIYSPDGHLLQVEYAQEAVRKGSTVVSQDVSFQLKDIFQCTPYLKIGLCTTNSIVLGMEKKNVNTLQEERTVRKICMLDDHVVMTFAGLTADARIIVSRAQAEAQSHRLNFEKPVSVEYITRWVKLNGIRFFHYPSCFFFTFFQCRFIAQMKQKYTQSNGRRPFGLSCLVGGFDEDGTPHLFQTEPSGIFYEWKASGTGRSGALARAHMEKHADEILASADKPMATLKHAVRTLVSSATLNQNQLEVAVLEHKQPLRMIDHQVVADLVREVHLEMEEEVKQRTRKTPRP
ncbi:hypothetical protein KR059_010310 [Drosophila kikkawai]|nr:hypothetical protein KR059_010310 [Drosophila kikkawai]